MGKAAVETQAQEGPGDKDTVHTACLSQSPFCLLKGSYLEMAISNFPLIRFISWVLALSDGFVLLRNMLGSKLPGLLFDFRCGSQSRSFVCIHVHVCAYMCMHVHGGQSWVLFLRSSPSYLLRQGLLLGPGAHQLVQAAWPEILVSPQLWNCKHALGLGQGDGSAVKSAARQA